MSIVKGFFLIVILALIGTGHSFTQNSQKPNVILVFIDDMGWEDFSSFGNTDAQTPNIDKLASEGISTSLLRKS